MSGALVLDLVRQAVTIALMVSAPLLATALFVGIAVSFVQAITQIQEQTLTFVPKFIAIAVVTLAALPWLLSQVVGYIRDMLGSLSHLAV